MTALVTDRHFHRSFFREKSMSQTICHAINKRICFRRRKINPYKNVRKMFDPLRGAENNFRSIKNIQVEKKNMYSVTKSLLFSNGESDDIKREIKQEKNSKDEHNHNFVTKTLLYQNLHFKKKLLCANYVILYFQIFSIFREIVTILVYKKMKGYIIFSEKCLFRNYIILYF